MKKFFLKSVVRATLPVVLVVSMLSGVMTTRVGLCANRADQLGSAVAVGSPVLNQNFAEDSWNPYELECFGVYLSNYVEPLTQTYKECFTDGGSGIRALQMSTKNDPANNRTLKGLTDVAIGYQFNHTSALYIAQYDENGTLQVKGDEDAKVVATLRSLYNYACIDDFEDSANNTWDTGNIQYIKGAQVELFVDYCANTEWGVMRPKMFAFYKEVEGNKKVMFDTTNCYDVDALNALLAFEFNSDSGEAFYDQFLALMDTPLAVDSFGNIVTATSGVMVFPACLNSHSTKDGTVNYVNRYMMNAYTTGGKSQLTIDWQSGDVYSGYIRGPLTSTLRNNFMYGGYPVNFSTSTATGMFYAQSCDLQRRDDFVKFSKMWGADNKFWYAGSVVIPSDLNNGDKYRSLYELMAGDFTMGSENNCLRFANPLQAQLGTKSGWRSTDQDPNGTGLTDDKPSLYWMIQLNALDSNACVAYTGNMSGYTPPAHIFNEIYYPGEDDIYCTLFNSNSSWRIVSSQMWAAQNGYESGNDQGIKHAEAAQAYINGLSHAVYDFSHNADSQTYADKGYGPFGAMGLSFISAVPQCIDGTNTSSFYTLTGSPSGKYDINIMASDSDKKLDVAWDTFKYVRSSGNAQVDVMATNDPDFLMPQQNFYKIYDLSGDSAVFGFGQHFSNGIGTFEDVASYIYVTYLNYFMIGRENDEYGVKTATSDFDPMFFDSNILFNDFSSMGIPAPSNEEQEVAARTRMMLLLDPDKGADYRREIVTSTLTKFCSDSYKKMTGKQFGSQASSALCLQEISENPFTGWLVDHEVWVILVFTFLALGLATWAAIARGKGWFWAICQIAVGIVGVVMIPFVLNAGVRVANFASQKIYSANADVWWLADAVENRYAEIGLNDVYNENAEAYDKMGLSRNQMANIVLGSSQYQSITFGQDISNKQTMPLSGMYAHLSQYPSAAWILPTLLDQSTVEDESAGGYTIRVGAFKKLSELEVLYWGYFPECIGDTVTWQSATEKTETTTEGSTDLGRVGQNGVVGVDGNVWYYGSLGEVIPPFWPLHNSGTITAGFYSPKSILDNHDDVWMYSGDTADKIYQIEALAVHSTPTSSSRFNDVGRAGSTFQAHVLSPQNNEYDWYLKGTESPLAYFYCVMQDTFYGFNTAQTIDALVGTTEYYGEGDNDYYNLNFLQATINGSYNINNGTGSLAADHTWSADAVGTDYARDILDLEVFYKHYAPLMYMEAIKTGGSQMGLDEVKDKYDVVGVYGSQLIADQSDEKLGKDKGWNYPIYEQNYASWMFNCNWAIKLYENPQNIKVQTVRDCNHKTYPVCPINPYTYPPERPFVTCRAQMVAYGLEEGDLSTIELANVQANDDAMLEIIKTINVYTNAPATLDVNSFKDLLAVKCLSAYANNINQAALTNSKYRIIPNGFEFDGICYDVVFSQMVYNTYHKANAYTVDDAVEGYIADEGPIMALFLTATAALGAVVIPFVLRIGLALLYVVNLWAALNAVIESLEHKASVLLASVVNTASFTVRTVFLFIVQGFLMSLGGAGIIVQKNQIAFRGSTTMLIITLLVFYVLYTISIIEFFSRTVQNGNDMGAAYLKANYEMSRDQGLLRFAQHRFAQSWGGKMLNTASRGMLGNEPKTSATGSSTTTSATGENGNGTTTSGTGEGGEGGTGGAVGNNTGSNTIENAKNRSNVSLNQAAEKTHAKGGDNPAGGSYIKESMEKGKQLDTRSEAFMTQAFGNPNESGTSNSGGGAGKTPAGQPKPKEEPKPEKPKEPKPEKPKDDGAKTKI